MNIDYVILGSDENPYYYDFWPIVSKIWKEVFKVTPVLGLISDEDSDFQKTEYGIIKKFKKIEKVDVGLQSQIVRIFLPKFLNGNCLVSDIDMIPLSTKYFIESSSGLTHNNLIIYSSDNPECLRNNMYPICYFAAHSNIFSKLFDLDLNWEQFCFFLRNRNEKWYTDQKYLYEKTNTFCSKNECIFLKRGWDGWNGPAYKRIDRINWVYDKSKVKEGHYIDCHSLRPFKTYKKEIEELVNLLFI